MTTICENLRPMIVIFPGCGNRLGALFHLITTLTKLDEKDLEDYRKENTNYRFSMTGRQGEGEMASSSFSHFTFYIIIISKLKFGH